ncbi:ATPase family associated with various cellular activities (AAA) [Rhizobium sp. RU35A]|uniref:AAA family ATPase n=1 Tax=Rhizobium sp. RU35A TaxID=1907414 RepID=UPI000956D124|nr:ATP-binding protein [Rhizobium sp. RU35A]SIR44149.1 ATPase family associated with various cellular activities (AAA) [Rhizobium sp. RU35A]
MSESLFDAELPLPDDALAQKAKTLIGFDERYQAVHAQLRLLLNSGDLPSWNSKFHHGKLNLGALLQEQYPFAIFHGDVGTGKTATAETIANRLVAEAGVEDATLFKMSNRVRGSGMVGEMGTLISQAFQQVIKAVGKSKRAILIIDEGDSLAANRSQEHSHHEDKVAVNTLIQHIDDLRRFNGRILVILCTNRLSVLDPALRRRAALVRAFSRPTSDERKALFISDLAALNPSVDDVAKLVAITGPRADQPTWTYSDIRTRLYPQALAKAFPNHPLSVNLLLHVAAAMTPSPVMEDK